MVGARVRVAVTFAAPTGKQIAFSPATAPIRSLRQLAERVVPHPQKG
jgi:hypothetical protein